MLLYEKLVAKKGKSGFGRSQLRWNAYCTCPCKKV